MTAENGSKTTLPIQRRLPTTEKRSGTIDGNKPHPALESEEP